VAVLVGGLALWLVNPPLDGGHSDLAAAKVPMRRWLTPAVVVVLAIAAVSTMILTGEDLGTVAALRDWGQQTSIGWVLALWGAGSAMGGVLYGALHRHPPAAALLAALAASTALVALAPDRGWFVVLLFVSGFFCAPTITATVDDLSRLVPAGVRGEAMGWHGSALTLGSAAGAPLVGVGIDHGGWAWGFALAGLGGLAIALVGLAVRGRRGAEAERTQLVEV